MEETNKQYTVEETVQCLQECIHKLNDTGIVKFASIVAFIDTPEKTGFVSNFLNIDTVEAGSTYLLNYVQSLINNKKENEGVDNNEKE